MSGWFAAGTATMNMLRLRWGPGRFWIRSQHHGIWLNPADDPLRRRRLLRGDTVMDLAQSKQGPT